MEKARSIRRAHFKNILPSSSDSSMSDCSCCSCSLLRMLQMEKEMDFPFSRSSSVPVPSVHGFPRAEMCWKYQILIWILLFWIRDLCYLCDERFMLVGGRGLITTTAISNDLLCDLSFLHIYDTCGLD